MLFTMFFCFIILYFFDGNEFFGLVEDNTVTVRFFESVLVDGEVISEIEIFPSLNNPSGFDRLLLDNVKSHETINAGQLLPSSNPPKASIVNGHSYQSRSLIAGESRPLHYVLGMLVSDFYVYSPTNEGIDEEPKAFSVVITEPTGKINTRAIYIKN